MNETRRHSLPLLILVALAAGGCGGDELPEGKLVGGPADSKTSYRDDPCKRAGHERRKIFHVTDNGFRPRKVVIRSGTPVTFINCGDKPHTVTKASGRGPDFDSGTLQPREKLDRSFPYVGTVKIVDRRNRGARMIVEVGGLPGEPQN